MKYEQNYKTYMIKKLSCFVATSLKTLYNQLKNVTIKFTIHIV
jgi:hypothetical protein